jgi:3-phenylpropionate/trans-cinnamate dioxygenase ferredoxin component
MSSAADNYVRVASVGDVPPNTLHQVEVGDVKVCLANADGQVYAFRDNCTHRDFPLHTGAVEGGAVECSWHGARFDIASGRAVQLPAIKPITTYDVRVDGDDIYVAVGD